MFLFPPSSFSVDSPVYQLTDNTVEDQNPSVHNKNIAWRSQVDGDYEIYYWDGTTTHQISDNTTYDRLPSLYNGTIAWQSNFGGDWEIFFWGDGLYLPIANAGRDQAVFDSVTLDGSASYDEDGSIVSYDWLLQYKGYSVHNQTAIGVNPTISDLYSGFFDAQLTVTDEEANTHTNSSVVAAAGPCDCTASTMYIESIVAGIVRGSKGNSYGEATVTVFDDYNKPVADANVTGTFTGDFDETSSEVTDGNGIAVIRTSEQLKKPLYEFCVISVDEVSLEYVFEDDVETCKSN